MVSPQLENGYTKIANEIIDALARTKLSSQESRILFAIFRKTYGYNKKQDWISNSQLEQITGIHRSHCANTISKLKCRKIVTKTGNKIQFNKLYSQWLVLPKQVTSEVLPKQVQVLPKQALGVTQTGTHKRQYTKDNNTKEILQSNDCGKQINLLMDEFKIINPAINFGNKTQRNAIEWFLKEFGEEKALGFIKAAIAVHGKPYAPRITTPYQLKEKLSELDSFYKQQNIINNKGQSYDITNI